MVRVCPLAPWASTASLTLAERLGQSFRALLPFLQSNVSLVVGTLLLIVLFGARSASSDKEFRRDLRGAFRFLSAFLILRVVAWALEKEDPASTLVRWARVGWMLTFTFGVIRACRGAGAQGGAHALARGDTEDPPGRHRLRAVRAVVAAHPPDAAQPGPARDCWRPPRCCRWSSVWRSRRRWATCSRACRCSSSGRIQVGDCDPHQGAHRARGADRLARHAHRSPRAARASPCPTAWWPRRS